MISWFGANFVTHYQNCIVYKQHLLKQGRSKRLLLVWIDTRDKMETSNFIYWYFSFSDYFGDCDTTEEWDPEEEIVMPKMLKINYW